ncbi:hypothetical protein ElyMa_006939800 [Elysia marginata]|uniref:Reverse transcriptase domain-containing protein n=1 Tax=Elysia marginata TaxID=1093978 RepID=A0AAV4JM34_9GAST|nr:hypothetical protein ElyMa_006939800 [Elysia marginata]
MVLERTLAATAKYQAVLDLFSSGKPVFDNAVARSSARAMILTNIFKMSRGSWGQWWLPFTKLFRIPATPCLISCYESTNGYRKVAAFHWFVEMIEIFVKNLRWKAFFLNPDKKPANKETYGFKSTNSPPQVPELKQFENDLISITSNLRFKKQSDDFQRNLQKDINRIRSDKRIYVPADKTNNHYRVTPDQFNTLIKKSIQKEYKKTNETKMEEISREDRKITEQLDISDRVPVTAKKEAFITLKDHKPNFRNNPTCRLINPCKSEIGKISKKILDDINNTLREATLFNQWRNTKDVINWFDNIKNKISCSFLSFDICEFYPSITEDLLEKALNFAAKHTTITPKDMHIIQHTKQTLLYYKNDPWCKKNLVL